MPDVGSDKLLHVNTEYHFFLLNITKAWRTHAPKKWYDSLKTHIQITRYSRTKISTNNSMYKLHQKVTHQIITIKLVSEEK